MTQSNEIAELIADIKEQVLYLQEIGVTDMKVDLSMLDVIGDQSKTSVISTSTPSAAENYGSERRAVGRSEADLALKFEIPNLRTESNHKTIDRPAAGSRLASLPSLKKLGASKQAPPEPETVEVVSEHANVVETIPEIRSEIGPDCTRCKLSQLGRKQVVNSVGNFNAGLMFVGEAPGADEDEQGEPFVGRAGQLLTKIIEGIGLSREDVFIGNINRCRPPKNRAPEPDETVECKPFILREIAVVKPKVIVVLGATAAQNLLETNTPIGKLRGRFHDFRGTKVMPTFHPAYLLRDPNKKREVWDDMKMVRDYLKGN